MDITKTQGLFLTPCYWLKKHINPPTPTPLPNHTYYTTPLPNHIHTIPHHCPITLYHTTAQSFYTTQLPNHTSNYQQSYYVPYMFVCHCHVEVCHFLFACLPFCCLRVFYFYGIWYLLQAVFNLLFVVCCCLQFVVCSLLFAVYSTVHRLSSFWCCPFACLLALASIIFFVDYARCLPFNIAVRCSPRAVWFLSCVRHSCSLCAVGRYQARGSLSKIQAHSWLW